MIDLSQPQQKTLVKAEIPLEKFNLSMRAYNCLKRAQVNFVSDLMNFSCEDLLEIKSFGSKSADEVIDALARIGMSLRQGRSPALAEQPVGPTDEELMDNISNEEHERLILISEHAIAPPLSPAAQAVASAYDDTPEKDTGNHRYLWLAAALRAVANQVVPHPGRYPMNEYMEGLRDCKQDFRAALLGIADELEAQ
jgi:hypothetical protein